MHELIQAMIRRVSRWCARHTHGLTHSETESIVTELHQFARTIQSTPVH